MDLKYKLSEFSIDVALLIKKRIQVDILIVTRSMSLVGLIKTMNTIR